MRITIETIPHSKQRYPTVGDWWFDERGNLEIRVSEMGNWKYEAAVAYHELREVLHCKSDGISIEEVDEFDIAFEENRPIGNEEEPGDDKKAPYHIQHTLATHDERNFLADLAESWEEYTRVISNL